VADSNPTAISASQVHVWEARPEDFADEASTRDHLVVLSSEERVRHDRFVFDRDRHVFRVAHAMLRHVLGDVLGVAPSTLTFVTGAWGRPELTGTPPPLRFSLSHTHGLVLCALSVGSDVGVDVEDTGARVDVDSVAATVLSPAEQAALGALPATERPERFLALWTLKEAVVKALGRGVSHPLETLSLEIGTDGEAHDRLISSVALGAGEWRLWRWRPAERGRFPRVRLP
jgi:4'-phosphopantetheinyl transferase